MVPTTMRCRICNRKITKRDSRGMFKSTCDRNECQFKGRSNTGSFAHPQSRTDADSGLRN